MKNALAFLVEHPQVQTQQLWSTEANRREALAVVAPELIRYQMFQDFLETQVLELAYVNGGKTWADFSIGPFQMKPSFAEQVENYLLQHPALQTTWAHFLGLQEESLQTQRFYRLERLKDFQWQLEYAALFYEIGLHRFDFLRSVPPEERIAFLAAAYNYGFEAPIDEIREWQAAEAFPYGSKYLGEQASYAELALAFYQQLP